MEHILEDGMNARLTADELFREFALTDSPFDKWHLFSHITDEATFIFLPNQNQGHLCNFQFGIFELLKSDNENDIKHAHILMKWLASKQKYVNDHFRTASPVAFYHSLKSMNPLEVENTKNVNRNLFLLFNLKKLSFQKRKKTFAEKILFWRQ